MVEEGSPGQSWQAHRLNETGEEEPEVYPPPPRAYHQELAVKEESRKRRKRDRVDALLPDQVPNLFSFFITNFFSNSFLFLQEAELRMAYVREFRYIRESTAREIGKKIGILPNSIPRPAITSRLAGLKMSKVLAWFANERSKESELLAERNFNHQNVYFLKEAFRVSPELGDQRAQRIASTAGECPISTPFSNDEYPF